MILILSLIAKIAGTVAAGIFMLCGACEAMERYERKEYLKSTFFVIFACCCAIMIAGMWV